MFHRPRAARLRGNGKGRGAPDNVRSSVVVLPFRRRPTLRAIVIRQRPVRWPCSGLTGTRSSPFPATPAVEEDEPIQAKTHPFASNHADGGRVSPASPAPDRSSIPLEPVPARSPPAATMVAGHAPFPRDEVVREYGRF